ncbi:MAG TPA: hypothetical protein ENI82_00050 [Bacteroidetes bacterium]|nr:hypothetical protein [Bacteroidota bacterium]
MRWQLDFSDTDCYYVYFYAKSLLDNEGIEALSAYVEQLENEITHSWELAFMDDIVSQIGPSAYYCGQPTPTNIIGEYYKITCYRYCFDFNSDPGPFVTKIRCGSGCCKRSTSRCLDPITHKWIETVTYEQTEECNHDTPEPPNCKGYLTDCIWGACAE